MRITAVLAALVLMACAEGCGRAKEEVIQIKPAGDPLSGVKGLLERYAEGQMLASEVASFPDLVEEVRKADPTKADMVEKGLNEIKANPAARAAIAKGLLQKLQTK